MGEHTWLLTGGNGWMGEHTWLLTGGGEEGGIRDGYKLVPLVCMSRSLKSALEGPLRPLCSAPILPACRAL